jgi:hypothetical protein
LQGWWSAPNLWLDRGTLSGQAWQTKGLILLCVALILPGLAWAGPSDGFYRNAKGPSLEIRGASEDGFDFALTAGATDGSYTCAEGAVDCLHVAGHADLRGKFYTYVDPDDDKSRIFFALDDQGITLVNSTGALGTGTGNRAAMVDLPGLYAPERIAAGMAPSDRVAPSDSAVDTLHFFRSPTGNVSCLFALGDSAEVRCDLAQLNRSFTTPPQDCDLEWGDSFAIGAKDRRGSVVCHGDTVADPAAEVLDYGSTLGYSGITCLSETSGMTCQNTAGHGFSVARKRQTVF